MKSCPTAILVVLISLTSCGQRSYSDREVKALFLGPWKTSTSFESTSPDTHIRIRSQGRATFNDDGTVVFETDSLMTITVPEGELPVSYHAVVYGSWWIDGQQLRTSRASELVEPMDALSRRFIEGEGMKKLRSRGSTNFVFTLKHLSPRKIVTLDASGSRTTYRRE